MQGADVHRNPSPGPGEGAFCYGHCWVRLAWAWRTAHWGTVAVPLGSKLYVRKEDLEKLPANWPFRTKPQLGLELVLEVAQELQKKGFQVVIVQDGAWAHRPYICRLRKGGLVVGRLRKDAALCDLPAPRRRGQRGRPRLYGTKRISLWKRAAHPKGWERVLCVLYGQEQIKTIKTFLATYRVAGGLIRVLLVQEQDGVQAYFSTNPDWTPEQILEAVADRGSIKQLFRDVKQTWKADEPRLPVDHPIPLPKRLKEVWKTDRPQLRNVWSNLATWHRRAVGQSSVNFGSPNPQRNVCLPLQWPASLHGAIPVVQPALAETDGWAA
ncbi:MAG: transposase [Thermoguttaceae bacterium]|nr:transposase [Thermoguttaceae bacterium]